MTQIVRLAEYTITQAEIVITDAAIAARSKHSLFLLSMDYDL